MNTPGKAIIKTLGVLLMLAALFYVGQSLIKTNVLASSAWFEPKLWYSIAVVAALYCGALSLIGHGWVGIVSSASDVPLPRDLGLAVYAQSHLYKYVPSNVLHYVGRQTLLSRHGISHTAIAWGSLVEALLLLVSAVSIGGLFGASLLARVMSPGMLSHLPLAAGAIAALLLLAFLIARRTTWFAEFLRRLNQRQAYGALFRAYVLSILFFLASGAALWVLLRWGCGVDGAFSTTTAVGAAAWALGLLTPGASAGIGIREATIIAGLGASGVPNEKAVLVAIAYRVATIIGDLLFTGVGLVLARRYTAPATN